MIEWYNDKELIIFFSHKPNTVQLEPYQDMPQEEKDIIEEYPFLNRSSLKVTLFDHIKSKKYEFIIPKGMRWDGATIPRLFWFIIGSKTNPKFRTPSLIHDFMCNNKYIVNFDRNFSSKVFKACLQVAGVKKWRRNIMYFFVDLFQRTQGWSKK